MRNAAGSDVAMQFRSAIQSAGLVPPDVIEADGKWHRFPSNGKRGDKAGWYVLYDDGVPAGIFGDWRTGSRNWWRADRDRQLTQAEEAAHQARVETMRRQRKIEEIKLWAEAGIRAKAIWEAAIPAPETHPYLKMKGVRSHGLRLHSDNCLIIPVMLDGSLSSLQFIDVNGGKQFLQGGAVKGGCFTIGAVSEADTFLLCEGFATGASLHEATGRPVVVAFNAGNLETVARGLRAQYPTVTLIVYADDDAATKGNPGVTKATEAAHAVAGRLAIPDFGANRPEGVSDFNDLAKLRGLDAVKEAITTVILRGDGAKVEPGRILDEVYAFLGRFVSYPSKHARVAHCLWVAHTHLMDAWESTPRLAFLSPEPGSGKTRAMELTETLVPRPIEAINVTSAYMFRKISHPEGLPTILHDEIDTIFGARAKEHEEIRGVINAGHRRGASAGRCVVKGKQIETEELPAFCAVALAGLGNLPDTILSRSVIIKMRRRAPGEIVEPYRRRIHAPEGYRLRDRLAVWTQRIRATLNNNPPMPDGITDRNADVWESLLSVADAAGDTWPDRAREAAVALVADAKGVQPSLGLRLLEDLRTVFANHDALSTNEILPLLIALEEAPWGDLKGKPLDARRLANLLNPYGVASKQVKVSGVNQRRYCRADLHNVWIRYLPSKAEKDDGLGPSPVEAATGDTTRMAADKNLYTDDPMEVIDLDA